MASFLIIDGEPARRRILKAFLGTGHEVLESRELQEANRVGLGREFNGVFLMWPMAESRGSARQPEKVSFAAQHLLPMVQHETDGKTAAEWAARMLPAASLHLVRVPEGKLSSAEILRALNRILSRPMTPAPELAGSSPQMLQLLEQASKVAANDWPVLLTGEPGTGKRTICRWIHQISLRGQRGGPFEEFHPAGLDTNEAYAELFGVGKGAFPWAFLSKPGLFEAADSGTLYIHEGGELPRPIQARLLRVLQNPLMSIERLGENHSRRVDVRVVMGSRWNLRQKAGGEFSEDLFYALSRNALELPPLRTRTEDLPELVRFMLSERILTPPPGGEFAEGTEAGAAPATGGSLPATGSSSSSSSAPSSSSATRAPQPARHAPLHVPDETLEVLRAYPWPGNLDELEAALAEAALRSQDVILPQALPQHLLRAVQRGKA